MRSRLLSSSSLLLPLALLSVLASAAATTGAGAEHSARRPMPLMPPVMLARGRILLDRARCAAAAAAAAVAMVLRGIRTGVAAVADERRQ